MEEAAREAAVKFQSIQALAEAIGKAADATEEQRSSSRKIFDDALTNEIVAKIATSPWRKQKPTEQRADVSEEQLDKRQPAKDKEEQPTEEVKEAQPNKELEAELEWYRAR